eukprot:15464226-Alexandrium_andersonii.AAC.1
MAQVREAEFAIRHGRETPCPPARNPRALVQPLRDFGMLLPQGGFTEEGFIAPRIDEGLWYLAMEASDVAGSSGVST